MTKLVLKIEIRVDPNNFLVRHHEHVQFNTPDGPKIHSFETFISLLEYGELCVCVYLLARVCSAKVLI